MWLGSCVIIAGTASGVVTTDAYGVATLTSWQLGDTLGTDNNEVQCTTPDSLTGEPVTFTASAVAGGAGFGLPVFSTG